MLLFFVKGEVDSDRLISYCYSQYRDAVSAFLTDLPEKVKIVRVDKEKPRLNTVGVFFNLSHSYGVTMVGFSNTEIGVDIEKIRPVERKRFDFIDADSDEEFFEKWTERESWLKFTGKGLSGGLRSSIPAAAHFEHFEPFEGYHACVCAEEQNIYAYELDPSAIYE